MASSNYKTGDQVQVTRDLSFGNIFIQKRTIGTIKGIRKKVFGRDEYDILWSGTNFCVTMYGDKDFKFAKVF